MLWVYIYQSDISISTFRALSYKWFHFISFISFYIFYSVALALFSDN